MDFDCYHDESQVSGYWHGILLVPRPTRQQLLNCLKTIRDNTRWFHPLTLKGLGEHSSRFRCTRAWIHFGATALIQKMKKPEPYYTGNMTRNTEFLYLNAPIGARFILFRVRDDHHTMQGYRDHAAKIETTFRMGLKGGLNLFSHTAKNLMVHSVHFDGHKHYGRNVDKQRIIGRLTRIRENISFLSDLAVLDGSSDHRKPDAQPYDDCQLLQLTDLLVGGFRTVLDSGTQAAQVDASQSLKVLSDKWKEGVARMRNSRWNGGFCISECWLENGEWRFGAIQKAQAKKAGQLDLAKQID